ncbi:hypothetical protein ACUJ46_09505 [Sandaracinobacteroides sp. A072]
MVELLPEALRLLWLSLEPRMEWAVGALVLLTLLARSSRRMSRRRTD